jgi:hypothetical protein
VQDAGGPTDTAESHQETARRELQHDNVEAAQVHALLAVGAAIERLARAVEDTGNSYDLTDGCTGLGRPNPTA